MEVKTNYTLVGVGVLILSLGLISAMLWLSIGFNPKSYSLYTVYLHEPASGLSQDAPVKYNGVQVGYVKQIKLNRHDPRQVEILLALESGTPVTTSTTAALILQGITGVTFIGLSASSADLTPLKKMPGDPYPVIPARPSLFNQLDTILKSISEDASNLTVQAQQIFNQENAKYISKLLSNMENFSSILVRNSEDFNLFMRNLAKASQDLPQVLQDLKTATAQFILMADRLTQAGSNVSKTMNSGKNVLDNIAQENLPSLVILLNRLNTIAANLARASSEMRENPAVLVRGTTAPKPGPGE